MRAIDGLSLTIGAGETVSLVGESGCGKSVIAQSIARLVPVPPANYVGGEILLNGRDVLKMPPHELCGIRGGVIGYVFQEPGAVLNPVFLHRRTNQGIAQAPPAEKRERRRNDSLIQTRWHSRAGSAHEKISV